MRGVNGFAYVGRKPCGCIGAAFVDKPEHAKDIAREVASWIRDGLTVERMTTEEVRAADWKCTHTTALTAQSDQLAMDVAP